VCLCVCGVQGAATCDARAAAAGAGGGGREVGFFESQPNICRQKKQNQTCFL